MGVHPVPPGCDPATPPSPQHPDPVTLPATPAHPEAHRGIGAEVDIGVALEGQLNRAPCHCVPMQPLFSMMVTSAHSEFQELGVQDAQSLSDRIVSSLPSALGIPPTLQLFPNHPFQSLCPLSAPSQPQES